MKCLKNIWIVAFMLLPGGLFGAAHPAEVSQVKRLTPSWLTDIHHAQMLTQYQDWWNQPGQTLQPRSNFVFDLLGVTEHFFRHKSHWSLHNLFNLHNAPNFVTDYRDQDGFYRRAAIFQGTTHPLTVAQWQAAHKPALGTHGYFTLLFYDPNLAWESDVRYLQSIPSNKGAAFQIASTFFGPLEGGIAEEHAYLENMFPHAAQGEEASVCAAGATFYRKYLMSPIYLLQNIEREGRLKRHVVVKPHFSRKSFIHSRDITGYNPHYHNHDKNNVIVFAHDNIAVTLGYGPHEGAHTNVRGSGPCQRLKVFTNPDGTMDTARSQLITQIFSSAINMSSLLSKGKINSNAQAAAQMALDASYQGTIEAAHALGKSRLFLTLMGGGAFRNNLDWVGQAIFNANIPAHVASGMQVTLLYRTDSRRPVAQDYNFLKNMVILFDRANGTHLSTNSAVANMIQAYISASAQNDTQHMSLYAQQLNDIFMRQVILPTVAPVVQQHPVQHCPTQQCLTARINQVQDQLNQALSTRNLGQLMAIYNDVVQLQLMDSQTMDAIIAQLSQ